MLAEIQYTILNRLIVVFYEWVLYFLKFEYKLNSTVHCLANYAAGEVEFLDLMELKITIIFFIFRRLQNIKN